MANPPKADPARSRPWRSIVLAVAVLIAIAIAALAYQSNRTGLSWRQMLAGPDAPAPQPSPASRAAGASILPQQPGIDFLASKPIGAPLEDDPQITNVDAVDLDGDGLLDVLVCDALNHRVSWIRQHPRGTFTEHVCAPDDPPIKAPAHVQAFDVDNDGDQDILVASLGQLFPTNEKVGSVVILENDGAMNFKTHVVARDLVRVADVRGGDLDGDGDIDLSVAMFGAIDDGTCWMENRGDWHFVRQNLQSLSGPINCPIVDIDEDGDLDIALLVSQEWEEIHLFLNDGAGHFTAKLIWGSGNEDFGSGQIRQVDLDLDGDIDFLYTNGDSWDYYPPRPRPWHGVHWLENRGELSFVMHRIVTFEGPYSALPIDVDLDGDLW